MTFWDWLASPIGVELQHAIIALILAGAAYLTYLSHQQARRNEQLLNGHLEQHVLDAAAKPAEHQADAASASAAVPPPDAT